MDEETEYKKLPIDERCVHKLWKARVDGYEEAANLFRKIDDEKSPEWSKFLGLVKKFVVDSNAVAQEKGLEATLIFAENCGHAGKTVGEVISGIVAKSIAAPRAKTKDLSVQVALMYVEIEKHEAVMEELMKGMEHKNPKIVSACVSTITLALKEFGIKVISVKPIIKKIPVLLTDRDKTVRDEGKHLAVEIFKWIGAALKPQLASLAPVLVAELEAEFDKVKSEKPTPTRYLRSQQERQAAIAVAQAGDTGENDDGDDGGGEPEEIDPMELLDPVDILSLIPKDFYEKLEAKKWQERKEALEALEPLVQNPKLESGEYGDLVRALKKVISKDTNVVLVAMAGKCMANLAKGLAKKFSPYASACVPSILEKFKEKKVNVVTALRDAIDAIYPSTNLEVIQEDIVEALNSKNPSVKSETAGFLSRAFTKTVPTVLNKKLLKVYVTALLKTIGESDPIVRDASAEALGTAMKLVGEKAISPYLTDIDALKMQKITECCEKAVIVVKVPVKKDRPATAPAKQTSAAPPAVKKGGSSEARPVSRPATATGAKKAPAKKAGGGGGLMKSASTAKVLPTERDMSPEEIDEKATELLTADVLTGLSDPNWKTRSAAMETFATLVSDLEAENGNSQALLRIIAKKPGLKDTNVIVAKLKLEAVKLIVEKMGLTVTTADYLLTDVTEKLSDAKTGAAAGAALTAIAEAIKLDYVVVKIMEFAFEQKSPKVQQETLLWVSNAIREFGFQVNPKNLLDDAKKAVQLTNPAVRTAAITLLGTMYLYMGSSLLLHFENEKPALKQQIQAEFDKNADQKAPAPSRGVKQSASRSSGIDENDEDGDADAGGGEVAMINAADLLPRIDISNQITEALLAEISDKNWKTRNEGLTRLQGILSDAKLIKSNIGDLPMALAPRLLDSNAKIAQTTMAICEQLATSMGPSCKQHTRTFVPGILHGLGDNKTFIRAASISCMNTWGDTCGYKEFFEGEMIADALKTGGPVLRTELWGWLAEKLPNLPVKTIQKDELHACLPLLYANICDRSADVRKNSSEAVLGIMIHLGYDQMMKALEKQKSTSKKDIQAALDKARPNLPVKPLPPTKAPAAKQADEKSIRAGAGANKRPATAKAAGTSANSKTSEAPQTARGKKNEDDEDLSPLLPINTIKNQRFLDEQKLKVLKWSFTQPREEFVELLRDQMLAANINRDLITKAFHDDFRYHLKVIELLIDYLPNNEKSLICNLDLVLKWLSLRFYDTNPSVLLKGLEYLKRVFTMLCDHNYSLSEIEASALVPHLILKIGDPKDAVRSQVRDIIRLLHNIHPMTKIFGFLMDGLKSKNARQRAECLDELGYLVSKNNTITICQPTAPIALKEIARHISDRDNSVRNAALNCVVQAYFITGEKIYKLIGQMSDKDLSMLDERIKRTKRPVREEEKPKVAVTTQDTYEVEEMPVAEEIEEPVHVPIESPKQIQQQPTPRQMINGLPVLTEARPFGLIPEVVAEIEKDWVKREDLFRDAPVIPKYDIDFLYSPIKIRLIDGVGYPQDRFEKLLQRSQNTPNVHTGLSPAHTAIYNNSNSSSTVSPPRQHTGNYTRIMETLPEPKMDPNILRIIHGIGNHDSLIARAAINELNDILESPEKQAVLRDYEEIYIQTVLQQFKHLTQVPLTESILMYQPLLASILIFFNIKMLGKNLGVASIMNVMSVLLGLMAENKLSSGDDAQYTKVINAICLKIFDRANFTNLNVALIRLLKETCSSTGLPKFTDLLMKCIWRNVKIMTERSGELNYEEVLFEIHNFMVALPSAWWAQRPSDTPLRTIKTVVHNMAKIKGESIVRDLNKIPEHSELHAYLIRVLKNVTKDQPNHNHGQTHSHQYKEQHKRMTKATHETMSQIFKLISDKETSKEGLTRLYQFKLENTDVDIQTFLKDSRPSFQKYIEDGLAQIEREKNQQQYTHHHGSGDKSENRLFGPDTTPGDIKSPEYRMARLQALVNKGVVPNVLGQLNSNYMNDNKMADENLNLNHHQLPTKTSSLQSEMLPGLSANRREMLQQKLAQLKQQK